MHRLLMIASLCGCAQHQEYKDLYDDVEAGSHWHLEWKPGVASYFAEPCPVIAPTRIYVADGSSSGCQPGCRCALDFELYDDGEIGTEYDLLETYDETCDDGSQLTCYPDISLGAPWSVASCDWWPAGWDHDVFHTGCGYTLYIERLDG